MDKIYAPWRSNYVQNVNTDGSRERSEDHCVFCAAVKANDDVKHVILKRGKRVFTIMNLYPYSAGHVMILPYEHHGELFQLDVETRAELMEEMNSAIESLKKVIKPHGFNTGLNIGQAGGGGIPSHLHLHVLPRWNGDTNFMPLLSNTRPISCSMQEIYELLLPYFK